MTMNPTIDDLKRLVDDGAVEVATAGDLDPNEARSVWRYAHLATVLLVNLLAMAAKPFHATAARALALRAMHLCGFAAWEAGRQMVDEPTPVKTARAQDWTVGPGGRENDSTAFVDAAVHVEGLIRGQAHNIVNGHVETVARLIMAQLAHVKGFAPLAPQGPPTSAETPEAKTALRDRLLGLDKNTLADKTTWRNSKTDFVHDLLYNIADALGPVDGKLRKTVEVKGAAGATADVVLAEYDVWRNGRLAHMAAPDLCNRLSAALRAERERANFHERAEGEIADWNRVARVHLRAMLNHYTQDGMTSPVAREALAFLKNAKAPADRAAERIADLARLLDAERAKFAAEDEAHANTRAQFANARADVKAITARAERAEKEAAEWEDVATTQNKRADLANVALITAREEIHSLETAYLKLAKTTAKGDA